MRRCSLAKRITESPWQVFCNLVYGIVKYRQVCFIGEKVRIGSGSRLRPMVLIEDHVTIGKNCFIGYGSIIRRNTIIGDEFTLGHLCVIEGDANIGDHVSIQSQSHIAKGTVICKDVFMGPMSMTINTKHVTHRERKDVYPKTQFIGSGAIIGAGSIILPGVTVGKSAVIGSGSIIVKDVSAGSLVFGDAASVRGVFPDVKS